MFNAGTPVLRVFLVSFLLAAGFILSVRAAPTSNDAECCGPEVTGAPPRSPYAGPKNRLCTAKEFHDKMNELNDNQNCSFEMDHASTQDVEWVPHKGKLHDG
ncbi:hypothetical protein AAVH_16277 [Aphelenchoides avenae]|nr:hypothetical protein AAVH_16277 [Aphelenchus avenae]